MTARFTRNAKMANGMFTMVTTMSLAYTKLKLTALSVQEGRHEDAEKFFEFVAFVSLFEPLDIRAGLFTVLIRTSVAVLRSGISSDVLIYLKERNI